ncbi:MAG: hypothetical protein EOM87_05450, partial [Clostridia bacterium]|nr:hypothetical protein [Clostridia bacterium]
MKKIILILLSILSITLIIGIFTSCAPFTVVEPMPKSEYDISVTLDAAEHKLTGSTQITYYSRIKGLSSLSLQLYANAYRDIVVSEQNIAAAYPKSKISYGGIEILGIT